MDTDDIVAVVLAAGRGTRMGTLTETMPKPLVPVLGKPALHWVVEGLIAAGVKHVVLVTGYLSDKVREAMAGFGGPDVNIDFVHQEEQLGTGHAMALTRDVVSGAPVLLAFADIMTSPENFKRMITRFFESRSDLVAAIRVAGDPWKAAAVYLGDEHSIKQIIEKPEKGTSTTPWSHAGMYCFSNSIFDYITRTRPSARGEYEITDAVQLMILDGMRSKAVELTGYWKDLATPEDIDEVEQVMARSAGEPHVR